VIGDRVKIQNNVSVYDGVVLEDGVFCGPSCVFTNVNTPRSLSTGSRATPGRSCAQGTIGANATIVCGVTLGRYSLVGAARSSRKTFRTTPWSTAIPRLSTGGVPLRARLGEDLVCPSAAAAMQWGTRALQ